MLVAQSAQLQSRLSAKGAVRESRKLEPKLPTGANDFKALPRRRDFETAVDPTKAWAQAVDEATDNFGRVGRAKTTSHEHSPPPRSIFQLFTPASQLAAQMAE